MYKKRIKIIPYDILPVFSNVSFNQRWKTRENIFRMRSLFAKHSDVSTQFDCEQCARVQRVLPKMFPLFI